MNKNKTVKITPIEKNDDLTVNQWVYRSLRKSLMIGQISPGSAITIRGLATELDVSPMPVREALRRLISEGALEMLDNRRLKVRTMTAQRFKELCDVRILLETHAAENALPYMRESDTAHLKELDKQVNSAYDTEDIEGGSLANQEFHRYLYTRNPHQVSLRLIEGIWMQLGPFFRVVTDKLRENYVIDRHSEAIDAIERSDSFALKRAIEADIRDGIATIQSIEGLEEIFDPQ
ncbi:GntR family transcriptional regulator [Terasakiella sp. SH-1]|uniref:GntR family transcriptional regulator n=1 Tax=Terasakiella sp. SH-1 TaxID=2560057 RepID=UPI001074065B|nr:GntR family transcriptional regulator [Terasakiella sp. SH-1]